MNSKKKILTITIIVAILVIGGVIGGIFGYKAYQTNKEYEELVNTATECEKMIQNMNYVYFAEDDTAKQARQRDLDTLKNYSDKIANKELTDDEKNDFSEFCKTLKKNFEQCATDTKAQFDAVQASKDSHTDEGYYSDEFNNEWNGYVAQYNDLYGKQEYFNAFQVVLNMQKKLNEYVAGKDKEAADRAEAERQQAEAEKASSSKSSSSSSKSSGSGSSKTTASNSNNGGGSEASQETPSNSDRRANMTPEEKAADQATRQQMKEIFNRPGMTITVRDANGNITSQIQN